MRHGSIWVTNGDRSHRGPPLEPSRGADIVSQQLKRLHEICVTQERDPASIDRLVLTGSRLGSGLSSPAKFAETVDVYEEVGVTDLVVHWPREDDPYSGDETILERIIK